MGLFGVPYLLLAPSHHHAVWMTFWEGLGDFDRAKGHAFHDPSAIRALHDAGLAWNVDEQKGWSQFGGLVTDETEAFFRASVLRDIRKDPGWYASILAHRTLATVLQQKLWPWGPRDGSSFARATHPNEGETDVYYQGIATADFVGLQPWIVELPVSLLIAPTAALFLLALVKRRRQRVARSLVVVLCCALGSIVAPVLVTTGSAAETQAFVLAYLLGFGFLAEELLSNSRTERRGC
jgi:hypothetical protein